MGLEQLESDRTILFRDGENWEGQDDKGRNQEFILDELSLQCLLDKQVASRRDPS